MPGYEEEEQEEEEEEEAKASHSVVLVRPLTPVSDINYFSIK